MPENICQIDSEWKQRFGAFYQKGYTADRLPYRSIGAVMRSEQGSRNERKDEKETICSIDGRYFDGVRHPVRMR